LISFNLFKNSPFDQSFPYAAITRATMSVTISAPVEPNCVVDPKKGSEEDVLDDAMELTSSVGAVDSNPKTTNGETAVKIPKLMDIEASVPTPKLMRIGMSAGPAASAKTTAAAVDEAASSGTLFNPIVTLEQVRALQHKFIDDRDWHQFHTPRNLLLAMVGEVGELSELFQWRGEVGVGLPGWTDVDKRHLRHELADVFLYLVRLSEQCGVDLPLAALNKIKLNEQKYPADQVKGSSKKYSDYPEGTKLAVPQETDSSP